MNNIVDIKDLSDSQEVMIKKTPFSISIFIVIMFGVFIAATIWASFGRIDEYATASGEVRPNDSTGTLTSVSGGKVSKIFFNDGDKVNVGDIIIEFDVDSIEAQRQTVEEQITVENEKIENYKTLKRSIEIGENLFSLSEDEQYYYYQYESYITSLNLQVDQIKQSNTRVSSEKEKLEKSIETADTQLTDLSNLLAEYDELCYSVSNYIEYGGNNMQILASYQDYKNNLDKANLIYDSYKLEYENLINNKDNLYESNNYSQYNSESNTDTTTVTQDMIDRAKYAMESSEKDVKSTTSKYLLSILTTIDDLELQKKTISGQKEIDQLQLKSLSEDNTEQEIRENAKAEYFLSLDNSILLAEDKITELDNQMIAIDDSSNSSFVKAQISGTIVFVQDIIKGDILPSGTQVGEIMPDITQLKILLYIPEKDISKVQVGQKVDYSVSAISESEYGKVSGEILSVSADSFAEESTGQIFYKAEATVNASSLTNKKGEMRVLQTGMIVDARIISGSQSVLSWVLDRLNFKD